MKRGDGDPAVDAVVVATQVHRLAVLLQAGLTPERAWAELRAGSFSEGGDAAAGEDENVGVGAVPGEGLDATLDRQGGPWRDVAAAWRVAATVGAPLAPSLRAMAESLRDASQSRNDVAVALAEPATTARLIGWLPLLGLVLGFALGFDVVATLSQPLGAACVVLGLLLMLAARRWTASLVSRAQPPEEIAGWEHDVVAIALTGGISVDRAVAVTEAAGCAGARAATAEVLALSASSGAPAVELLRAEAADRRRAARTEGRLRAARLSGRLLIPLGVCTLPAFLLLGVAPMLLAVLSSAPLDL